MKKFAEMLKKTREDKGLRQTDLAKKAKISQGRLNQFEAKKDGITLEYAYRLSKALRCSLDYLCTGEEPKKPQKNTAKKAYLDKNKDFLQAFWLMFNSCFDLSEEDKNFIQAYVKAKKKS